MLVLVHGHAWPCAPPRGTPDRNRKKKKNVRCCERTCSQGVRSCEVRARKRQWFRKRRGVRLPPARSLSATSRGSCGRCYVPGEDASAGLPMRIEQGLRITRLTRSRKEDLGWPPLGKFPLSDFLDETTPRQTAFSTSLALTEISLSLPEDDPEEARQTLRSAAGEQQRAKRRPKDRRRGAEHRRVGWPLQSSAVGWRDAPRRRLEGCRRTGPSPLASAVTTTPGLACSPGRARAGRGRAFGSHAIWDPIWGDPNAHHL